MRFRGRQIRELLFTNWHLKIFSLVLATALWAVLAQESTSEIIFDVPVEYQNVPPATEVIGDAAKKVEVRLRGPSSLIREISEKDISTVIDLDQMPLNGETTVPLNAQHVHAPFGVEVVRVTPPRVRVSLEPTESKMLHVLPATMGHVAQGYEVDAILVKPDQVRAEGPASHVRVLVAVRTTEIDLTDKKSTIIQTVDLDLADTLVRFPETTPIRVEVKIRRKP
jgi:YbbR domain-containing protein